ncbi:MAG: hypothetical protein M0R46_03890 [Candidatus Muirbacterium halophilum]|nr:hypothetical protein [Candidatus Muirbacterium halophilum]MCK9475033.1 hypothetical protein [Candidatus Muirbacterium halophilum]
MTITNDPGIWVAAILTLAIFSFLIKDNPLYKLAEHIFVGASAGYYVVITYHEVLVPKLVTPLSTGAVKDNPYNLLLIIPLILGIIMLTKLSRKHSWMARYPLSFTVGVGAGLGITAVIKSDIISQIYGIAFQKPLWFLVDGKFDFTISFFNLIYVVSVLSSLLYFFFSAEHKGVIGKTARLGIWFLMISFGASFGFTVMARISLLIARVQFLLEKFLGIMS